MNKILLRCSWLIFITLSSWHTPIYAKIGQFEWQYKTQSPIWGDVKINNDWAYIANDSGQIIAIDIENKISKWQFTTQGKVRSHAAFFQDLVLFTSDDGFIYALNQQSGELVWQQELGDANYKRVLPANHAPWVFDHNKSSPVVDEHRVFVGSATGDLFAFQAKDGQKLWRYKAADAIRSTPSIDNEKLYVSSKDGVTVALDKSNGHVLWQHQSKAAVISHPLVIQDKVIIGSRDTNIYALNKETGKEVWRYTFPDQSWVESSATASADGKHFYIGSSDSHKLHKFDASNGNLIWHYDTKGWTWGSPFEYKDTVFIGSMSTDQYWKIPYRAFHAVDAQSGQLQWQYQPQRSTSFVTGGVHGKSAVHDQSLLVPDLDGSLKVFKLP